MHKHRTAHKLVSPISALLYFGILIHIPIVPKAQPLAMLAYQLNTLITLTISSNKRYLLHEYLKNAFGNLTIACHNSSIEPENHHDIAAYNNISICLTL